MQDFRHGTFVRDLKRRSFTGDPAREDVIIPHGDFQHRRDRIWFQATVTPARLDFARFRRTSCTNFSVLLRTSNGMVRIVIVGMPSSYDVTYRHRRGTGDSGTACNPLWRFRKCEASPPIIRLNRGGKAKILIAPAAGLQNKTDKY